MEEEPVPEKDAASMDEVPVPEKELPSLRVVDDSECSALPACGAAFLFYDTHIKKRRDDYLCLILCVCGKLVTKMSKG
jgi:hypothetical protein